MLPTESIDLPNEGKFVGVDTDFVPKTLNRKAMKGVYSLQRLKLWNMFNLFYYDYNKERTRLEPKKKNLFEWIMILLIFGTDKLIENWVTNKKPKLKKELKKDLIKFYKKDLKKLEKMIDRDLSKWYKL